MIIVESYYSLIEKGQEAIQGILDIAKEVTSRAYEVADNLSDKLDKRLTNYKTYKKIKTKEVPNKTNANIKNALFVGSTAELQKMLNKKKPLKLIVKEKVKMKILKAKTSPPNKEVFKISELTYNTTSTLWQGVNRNEA